jgi:hypothetical protein
VLPVPRELHAAVTLGTIPYPLQSRAWFTDGLGVVLFVTSTRLGKAWGPISGGSQLAGIRPHVHRLTICHAKALLRCRIAILALPQFTGN